MIELRTIERSIIEALGTDTLTLEQLAPRAGYDVNGHFKRAVSAMTLQHLGRVSVASLQPLLDV